MLFAYWSKGSRRLARLVLRGGVFATFHPGITAQAPSAANNRDLDLYSARFGRSLFAKKAYDLYIHADGGHSFRPVPNKEVLAMVGWAGSVAEARVHRLRRWQKVAGAPF